MINDDDKKKYKTTTNPKTESKPSTKENIPKLNVKEELQRLYNTKSDPSELSINEDNIKQNAPVDGEFLKNSSTGHVFDNDRQVQDRANNQPWTTQLGRTAVTSVANGILEIPKMFADVADVEDYANQDDEVGNQVSNSIADLQAQVTNSNPVYGDKITDSGYWFKGVGGVIQSAIPVVAGGGVIARGLQTAAKLAKMGQAGEIIAQLFTTLALNQYESIESANQVKNTMDLTLLPQLNNGEISQEEYRQRVADAQTTTVLTNRAAALLDIPTAGLLMKATKIAKPQLLKTIANEMGQEYVQEDMNILSEKVGLNKGLKQNKSTGDLFEESFLSKEAVETGFWGAIGGGIQAGGAMATSAFNGELAQQKLDYNNQQSYLKDLDGIMKSSGVKSMTDVYKHAHNVEELSTQLQKASDDGDVELTNNIKKQILASQVDLASKNDSVDKLSKLYSDIATMSGEEAAAKGFDIKEDSDTYFRKEALNNVQKIKQFEKLKNKANRLGVNDSFKSIIYNNLINLDNVGNNIDNVNKEILEKTIEVNVVKSRLMVDNFSPENLNLKLQEYSSQKELNQLLDKKAKLQQDYENINNNLNQISDYKTQTDILDKIKKDVIAAEKKAKKEEKDKANEPVIAGNPLSVIVPLIDLDVNKIKTELYKKIADDNYDLTDDDIQQMINTGDEKLEKYATEHKTLKKSLVNIHNATAETLPLVEANLVEQIKEDGSYPKKIQNALDKKKKELGIKNKTDWFSLVKNANSEHELDAITDQSTKANEYTPDLLDAIYARRQLVKKPVEVKEEPLPEQPVNEIKLYTAVTPYLINKETKEILYDEQDLPIKSDNPDNEGIDFTVVNSHKIMEGSEVFLKYIKQFDGNPDLPMIGIYVKNPSGDLYIHVGNLFINNTYNKQYQSSEPAFYQRIVDATKDNDVYLKTTVKTKSKNAPIVRRTQNNKSSLKDIKSMGSPWLPKGEIIIGDMVGPLGDNDNSHLKSKDELLDNDMLATGKTSQIKNGSPVLYVLTPNGTLYPEVLYSKTVGETKIGDIPMMEIIDNLFDEIKSIKTHDQLKDLLANFNINGETINLNHIIDLERKTIVNDVTINQFRLSMNNGLPILVTTDENNKDKIENNIKTIKNEISKRFVNYKGNVARTNEGGFLGSNSYTDFFVDNGIFSTTLNPSMVFTGNSITLDTKEILQQSKAAERNTTAPVKPSEPTVEQQDNDNSTEQVKTTSSANSRAEAFANVRKGLSNQMTGGNSPNNVTDKKITDTINKCK